MCNGCSGTLIPSMSFCKLYAHEFTHRVFFFHQGSCSCSLVLVGSGTGRLSATVAQASIRGLATARTCVVAGFPRTQRGSEGTPAQGALEDHPDLPPGPPPQN